MIVKCFESIDSDVIRLALLVVNCAQCERSETEMSQFPDDDYNFIPSTFTQLHPDRKTLRTP